MSGSSRVPTDARPFHFCGNTKLNPVWDQTHELHRQAFVHGVIFRRYVPSRRAWRRAASASIRTALTNAIRGRLRRSDINASCCCSPRLPPSRSLPSIKPSPVFFSSSPAPSVFGLLLVPWIASFVFFPSYWLVGRALVL